MIGLNRKIQWWSEKWTVTVKNDNYSAIDHLAWMNGGLMARWRFVGQKRGNKNMEYNNRPKLNGEIFEISANKRVSSLFLWKQKKKHWSCCIKNLQNIIIRESKLLPGMYSPPFRSLTEEEDKAIIERINETKPDFVWVGFGAQNRKSGWQYIKGKIDGLMLGVGAGFDYYAENIKRAPMWMQKHNLEWVYRLVQDPKRLFKRYWSTNTKFIWNAMIRGK